MDIVETSIFTKKVNRLLPDDEYRELQETLMIRPDAGAKIPGSGGIRKLRRSASGHGKRGGARIIYYWFTLQDKILMLYLFEKSKVKISHPIKCKY